ncbi:hypothetical protein BGZ94_008347 [Podila epigama]|nr:hypothetical protein BGZ94_008347 [Podila epigama]
MATILSHNPIILQNAFSLLDDEHDSHSPIRGTLVKTNTAESLSTWSVVNSAAGSDDEDYSESDEIYTWQHDDQQGDSSTVNNTLGPISVSHRDGFMNISKTMTVSSINGVLASAPELRDVWVVKVSKKRSGKPTSKDAVAQPLPLDTASVESSEDENYDATSMTEHELSKSAKAVKLKNIRLAVAYEKEMYRVLGFSRNKATCGHRPKSHKVIRAKNEKGRNLTGKI